MSTSETPVRDAGAVGRVALRDLGLDVESSPLAVLIGTVRQELASRGLTHIAPHFYLSTEWGVPFGTISVAIPFYLARPELTRIHAERVGHVEGAGPSDILRYLRHEVGHVVNYAYRLYERPEWTATFGDINQDYIEEYRPHPFSPKFVRNLPGWYAQKHPDEDWAETFAVWLTSPADWRRDYAGRPQALAKLDFCDKLLTGLRDQPPLVTEVDADEDVGGIGVSLDEWYRANAWEAGEVAPELDDALATTFETPDAVDAETPGERRPAASLIAVVERDVIAEVFRWTGHFPERTRLLLRSLKLRSEQRGLVYPVARESTTIIALTALVTGLAMNHVLTGSYLPPS